MATIAIAVRGTLGDHLPVVGLGRALAARGHTVRMACNQAMRPYAKRAGLLVMPLGERLGAAEARRHAAAWDHWAEPDPAQRRWTRRSDQRLLRRCQALADACRGADLLVASVTEPAGSLVHESLGFPWATVAYMPAVFAAPPARATTPTNPAEAAYLASLAAHLRRVRERLGLPDRPLAEQLAAQIAPWTLLGSSSHFSPPPAEPYSHVRTTGFWFYDDPTWQEWRPDPSLAGFMVREPRPLVLSFSSQPLADPRAVLAVHARAALALGRRLVVQRGWARFSAHDLPADVPAEDVLFADLVPHDWLFARAAAAIMHGGIGSLARALRAGCPVAIEPYGNDQFFNARQVVALGLGVAMHPHRLTPAGLARALREKVLTPECRARVAALGARIRAEDGLAVACDTIEAWLGASLRDGVLPRPSPYRPPPQGGEAAGASAGASASGV
jgi:UDP:flavonoid glycosyltransferase YjiC (YdhE family)